MMVGGAFAVGEQPLCGLISPAAMARRTLAETLTNLVFAPITCIKDIKLSGNWMWAAKCEGEGARLVEACDALCVSLRECGIAIDGGKDSLSMAVRVKGELVKSPGTLVLSAYAPCEDITKVISPDFKADKKNSIIYIRINPIEENRLGGSALAQCLKQIGDRASDVESFEKLILLFETVQKMIVSRKVLAGHDISDGGFITALLEMAFAGNVGVDLNFQLPKKINLLEFLFAEEVGLLLEIQEEAVDYICKEFSSHGLISIPIGRVVPEYGPKANVKVTINDELLIDDSLCSLREIWEETSDRLNRLQTNNQCIEEEIEGRKMVERWDCRADFDFSAISIPNDEQHFTSAPRVGVLREEGSNGDREMAAAFYLAGFSPYDITMTDLLNGFNLDTFRGLAFVGGFSYADVLGSAKGWAASIAHHPALLSQFEHFRSREDTFSFGVCNGCQLMALLGWIGEYENKPSVFLDVNRCGRFHSNWVHVKIRESRAIMLNGMHEATLGIWSVHGEGRFTYRKADVLEKLEERGQIAVQYVNPRGEPTERFPWNPNGSEKGVAAICSENGRHLAMMPHSDRSFMAWQWPDHDTTTGGSETPFPPCDDDCAAGRFALLYEVFIPGLCVFALLICCSRIVFAYLRHRLDRQFLERHGMTRREFIASIDTIERQQEQPTITEREWRLRQMLTLSSPPSPPTYDEVSKQQPPPSYEQARAQDGGRNERRERRRRRRDHPPAAPPPYEPVNSVSARIQRQPPRSRSVLPSSQSQSNSLRNRSRSVPVTDDLRNQPINAPNESRFEIRV
ncbi:unnamed protein product, partial [Mesorhabditis belari]|uniref:Phosphoribosylformylglycinamidine synthase n=1 Tax=Mesorhabditis belari TaxID=2138241 RepID=A0AAF3J1C6_9BILA